MTKNLETVPDKDELRELVADALELPTAQVTDDADFIAELDVESLALMEIVVAMEKRYGIKVQDEEFSGMTSLNRAYEMLMTKLGEL